MFYRQGVIFQGFGFNVSWIKRRLSYFIDGVWFRQQFVVEVFGFGEKGGGEQGFSEQENFLVF